MEDNWSMMMLRMNNFIARVSDENDEDINYGEVDCGNSYSKDDDSGGGVYNVRRE